MEVTADGKSKGICGDQIKQRMIDKERKINDWSKEIERERKKERERERVRERESKPI